MADGRFCIEPTHRARPICADIYPRLYTGIHRNPTAPPTKERVAHAMLPCSMSFARLYQLSEEPSGSKKLKLEEQNHIHFMELALEQARTASSLGEVPVGAVLVEDGNILAQAHNLRETSQDPLAHAELLALRRASRKKGFWKFPKATLYVTLEPCPMCAGALVEVGLQRLVYGAASPGRGCAGSLVPLADLPGAKHQVEVRGGLLADKCGELLTEFFRTQRTE